jgi:DNA replication protein DnaC
VPGVVIEGTCDCGAPVRRELPDDAPPFVRAMAIRQRESGFVQCAACGEREEAERAAREREEARAVARERRRQLAGLPPKWAGQTFAALDDDGPRRRALLRAGEWARGELAGLVLWGPVGRGKTAIAAAAANLRMERSAVRWLPVADLLLDLRMPFDSPEYARAVRKLDAMKGRAALVLDDLDKLKPTEHAVQPLYVAVNGWIEAELPLLVTLNRDLDELMAWMPETFGEALASRLSGYCATVEVSGRDRRIEP